MSERTTENAGPHAVVLGARSSRMEMVRRYFGVRPATFGDAIRFIVATLLVGIEVTVSLGQRRRPLGHFLLGTAPVQFRYQNLHYRVRPRTEDIAVVLQTHELPVAGWFQPTRGQRVVDVGAHIGSYTVRAAAAGAQVVAIEPDAQTFAILERNVRENGFSAVRLLRLAVSDREEKRALFVPSGYFGRASFVHGSAIGREDVLCDTLDHLIPESEFPRVDWLKIDVEGFEVHALEGASALLGRTERIILEVEHPNRIRAEDLLVRRHGFQIVASAGDRDFDYLLLQRSQSPVAPPA